MPALRSLSKASVPTRATAQSAMAQLARQREAPAGGALERQYCGEGLGEESANSIGC